MHSYATNTSDRKFIPFFLAVAAILAAWGVSYLCAANGVELPWWAPPVDTMTFYGVLYWLYDFQLWKWSVLRWATHHPNLNGLWKGTIEPGATGVGAESTKIEISLSIKQTWQNIAIVAFTEQSKSESTSANLSVGPEIVLSYEYSNEPRPASVATMHAHRGTARLVLEDSSTLRGQYYTGRDRQSFGSIVVRRSVNGARKRARN